MKKIMQGIGLGLLGISGILIIPLGILFLPDSVKYYQFKPQDWPLLVMAITALELVVIFGPIFLALSIARKTQQKEKRAQACEENG